MLPSADLPLFAFAIGATVTRDSNVIRKHVDAEATAAPHYDLSKQADDFDNALPAAEIAIQLPTRMFEHAARIEAYDQHRPSDLAGAFELFNVIEKPDKDVARYIKSDMAMLAKVTGRPLQDLPCAPVELRPILEKVRHARHNITKSRWCTIKSSTIRVLKATGWVDRDATIFPPLKAEWRAALDALPQPAQKAAFSGFARYCVAHQVCSKDVTLAVMQAYKAWRVECTLSLNVTHVTAVVRRLWTWLQTHLAAWPQTLIEPLPEFRRQSLYPGQFPECFQAELNKLIGEMTMFQPLDPRFKKKYSAYTIVGTRQSVLRAATVIAANRGGSDSVRTLRDVLAPAPFRTIMMDHFERVGKSETWAPSARTFGATLKRAAKICGQLSAEEIVELGEMISLINSPQDGLSVSSRGRIAQFYDPEVMRKLAHLPSKIFDEADNFFKAGLFDRAARCHARALQLGILIVNPLRRRTLASLDIVRHFKRNAKGRITFMLMPIGNSKNDKIVEGLVPEELSARIDCHIEIHRKVFLKNHQSDYLFPGGDGGHVNPDTISRTIKELVQSELGVDFNVHLIRHIVATMLLETDYRNMPLAQQILGHRDCKTTERIYGHARGHAAQQVWNKRLESYETAKNSKKQKRGV